MTVVVTAYFFTSGECLGPLVTRILGGENAAYRFGVGAGLALAVAATASFIPLIAIKQRGSVQE
jgi:hypothetical protein